MAFRLHPEESVSRGLRRLARKELRTARRRLHRHSPPTDEAVHKARTSLKKVAAIAGVLQAGGARGIGGFDKHRRRANKILSTVRDSAANVEILHKLKDANPSLISAYRLRRLQQRLQQRRRKARRDVREHDGWRTVERELRRLRKQAARWRPKHRHFKALAAGIRRSYRSGREALRRAQRRQDASDFHDLRQQIKQLWYALRLLEAGGRGVRQDVATLHSLESWLGDDHNIVVLTTELSSDRSICQGLVDVDQLRLAGHRVQCQLRSKALHGAQRFYRRRAAAYVQRLARAWLASQQHQAR